MAATRQILAAIFDMDGLLIDSEPLWDKAELEILADIGVDISRRNELPDTLGLRIDLVVELWFNQQPWRGPSRKEVSQWITERAISLIAEQRPLLPGVHAAVALCKNNGLKVGLASASPLRMLEQILDIFQLRDQFDTVTSAEDLPYSKPHPQVYLNAASRLAIDPLACVTLEDSINGMIATKAARMRSIVVPAPELRNDRRWSLAEVNLLSLNDLTISSLTGQ